MTGVRDRHEADRRLGKDRRMFENLMAQLVEHDASLAGHGSRVAAISSRLGQTLDLPAARLQRLEIAAVLHDIGKLRVDGAIVGKPGPLDPAEWSAMRRHPALGFAIVAGSVHPEIAQTILCHHERWDGTGYPRGLGGSDIPLTARILLVADAFDAMISERCYQPALPFEHALDEIRAHAGTQFDPRVAEAMLEIAVTEAWLDTVVVEVA